MADGAAGFRGDFTGPHLLRILLDALLILVQGYHLLWLHFPEHSNSIQHHVTVLQPRICRNNFGLGSSAFARHYLRNHCYFLFLQVLRCFSSLRSPPFGYPCGWVSPFGNLRINACVRLPVAYRSLPRPSSPLRA